MQILAHRGYWNDEIPKNSMKSFEESLSKGFGFETDIRDYTGKMVISHNVADESCPLAEEVFKRLRQYEDKYCIAINVKADGLENMLKDLLLKYSINNYFTFDMSVPQMIVYSENKITFFTRQSEYEPIPTLYKEAAGVWVDAFVNDDWINEDLLKEHQLKGKRVCIVSPDLHKKPYLGFWSRIKNYDLNWNDIILCTDHPEEAEEFFK